MKNLEVSIILWKFKEEKNVIRKQKNINNGNKK